MVGLHLSTPAHPPLGSQMTPLLPAALLVVLQIVFTPLPSSDAPVAGWDKRTWGRGSAFS